MHFKLGFGDSMKITLSKLIMILSTHCVLTETAANLWFHLISFGLQLFDVLWQRTSLWFHQLMANYFTNVESILHLHFEHFSLFCRIKLTLLLQNKKWTNKKQEKKPKTICMQKSFTVSTELTKLKNPSSTVRILRSLPTFDQRGGEACPCFLRDVFSFRIHLHQVSCFPDRITIWCIFSCLQKNPLKLKRFKSLFPFIAISIITIPSFQFLMHQY